MPGIVDIIHSNENVLSLGPVNTSEIKKAEAELSVHFAQEYKDYTSAFGAISTGEKEYTGAVQPISLDVVAVTKAARDITPSAKPEWYVVMDPHFDGIIIWQDGNGKIYRTEPGREPMQVAINLAEFMKS